MIRHVAVALMLALASPALATVSTTATETSLAAAGGQTVFTFAFHTLASSDIKVYVNGVLQGSGYTVALNATQKTNPGGTVTFTLGRSAGDVVRIKRSTPAVQSTSFTVGSAFPARSVETSMDRLTLAAQDAAAAALETEASILAKVTALNSSSAAVTSASSVLAYGSSTPRSLTARFSDTFNLRDFGAAGDGITDDTAEVQAALTAGAGKTVVCSTGTYAISGTLSIPSGTRLVGEGACTLVQRMQNTKLLSIRGVTDVVVENVELQGYGLGDWAVVKANALLIADDLRGSDATLYSCADAVGVFIYNSQRVKVLGSKLSGFRNSGIRVIHASQVNVEGNDITGLYPSDVGGTLPPTGSCRTFAGTDPGLYPPTNTLFSAFGIDLQQQSGDAGTYPAYKDLLVSKNRVRATSFGLFAAPGMMNQTWADNQISDVAQHCGYFYPDSNLVIDRNTCERPNFDGFKIQSIVAQYRYPLTNLRITNNLVKEGMLGAVGILVTLIDSSNTNADNQGNRSGGAYRSVVVSGNQVSDWTGVAYHVDHVDGLTMEGNSAARVLSYGYFLHDVSGLIKGNELTDGSRDGFYVLQSIGRSMRVIGNQVSRIAAPQAWRASSAYRPGDYVQNSSNVYSCVVAGTSASSGGPTGTTSLFVNGSTITDGTAQWSYIGTAASFAPLAYYYTQWAYDPVTHIDGAYVLPGTTTQNGSNFYIAVRPGFVGTGTRPTCSTASCTSQDGDVTWAFIGTTSSLRGIVHFEGNSAHQGPLDNPGYSLYYAPQTYNTALYVGRNYLPDLKPDGTTVLSTRLEATGLRYHDAEVSGGSWSGALPTSMAGAQGRPARDFIANGTPPASGRHQAGDRAWNVGAHATVGVPWLWVCRIGGTPCASWVSVQLGVLGANTSAADSVGSVTLSGGTYTLNYSKTYTNAPLCVCANTTNFANGCRVSSAGTSSVTFTASGATDVINYHCALRD